MLINILIALLFGFIFGFLYRAALSQFAKKSVHGKKKNINTTGRWLRGSLGIGLLVGSYFLSWNPLLLFFAGFCFFEAIFSWCGFYAAIGKDSCPLE